MTTDDKNEPSLHFIFDEVKDRLKAQFQQIDALDTKASIILGFGGLIFINVFISRHLSPSSFLLYYTATSLIFVSVIFALLGFIPRPYRRDPEPKPLKEKYLSNQPDETRRQVLLNFIESYDKNKQLIRTKVKLTKTSLSLLLAGLFFVGLSFVIEGW